jgi:hypothetical protein
MQNSKYSIGDNVHYGRIIVTIINTNFFIKTNCWMYEINNPKNGNQMFVKETELSNGK